MFKGYIYIYIYIYILFPFINISCFNLVPPLEPNITKNYYGLVYAGTPLTQNCSLQLDDLVDINTIVSFKWRKNGMIFQEDSRVTISFITISSMEYVSSLSFNPLNITDNGQYHCYVSVVPTVTDNYILNASANITRNITVNSELKIISTFSNINYVII